MSYLGNQPNSVAFLTDQFSGNGSTVVFTMSVAPAATSSILVNISGITQDPTTYAISGTTLTFSAAPPLGVGNISVRYLGIPASAVATTAYRTVTEFTATANQVTFNVPSYTIGYIDVYRNGIRLGAADFTASNGTTVVLAAGALLGDLIVTESFYVSSVLNAIPAVAGAVNSTYLADNSVISSKIPNGAIGTAQLGVASVTSATMETLVLPLGVSQTWQDVKASRAYGTTYTNSTGRPIYVYVYSSIGTNGTFTITVNGVTWGGYHYAAGNCGTPTFIVPSGGTYSISTTASLTVANWMELR